MDTHLRNQFRGEYPNLSKNVDVLLCKYSQPSRELCRLCSQADACETLPQELDRLKQEFANSQ